MSALHSHHPETLMLPCVIFGRDTKASFRGKLMGDGIRLVLATIRPRTFCRLVCYPKTQKLEYTKLRFYLWFCMGVKCDLWH
jgi:hypothetical protein